MEVEIELSGHKGRIRHIWGRVARPPWNPKDVLDVWIEFDEPYPEGISGVAIIIPAKEYYPRELVSMIRKEGEKQLAKTIKERIKERVTDDLRKKREEAVNTLAEKAERALE